MRRGAAQAVLPRPRRQRGRHPASARVFPAGDRGHPTSGYVARAKDYVRKHYRERIYLEPIAASLGISANYLSKLFYQETGEHLFDFVSRVRVERAANLLLHSEMKLDQIAEYVHFPSQSYFGKMFKRFQGVTPRAFREQNRVKEYQPRTR